MKKKTILFIAFIMMAGWAHAQGSISNIQVEERADELRVVDITFDLAGGGAEYNILLEVSFNGEEFEAIDPNNITGSVSNVAPAANIGLVWDGSINHPTVSVDNARIKITATHVCGRDFTFTYRGSEVTYGTVSKTYILPEPSKEILTLCWLDRNLGATTDPAGTTTNTNADLYGDLFQWGRLDDGHQDRTSTTTSTLSTTDVPGHDDFILATEELRDWRSDNNNNRWNADPQENNPCPPGWRVPIYAELHAERLSWDSNNSAGAYASTLKWPVGGVRYTDGALTNVGSAGGIWSSSVSGSEASYLHFHSSNAYKYNIYRAQGVSVRCVRDN